MPPGKEALVKGPHDFGIAVVVGPRCCDMLAISLSSVRPSSIVALLEGERTLAQEKMLPRESW